MPDAQLLVLNAGSSSLKYRLFGPPPHAAGGLVDRIGQADGPPDHDAAFACMIEALATPLQGVTLAAVGHRVVHGGPEMRAPVLIDDRVEKVIDSMSQLAPAHNPPALRLIRAARQRFPAVVQVAVFDTAFHATMPAVAREYAVDALAAERHGIRRYGFHGISVQHVVAETARLLNQPGDRLNMIVLHLGNGASATAVAGGRSVDTSMGMTPLEGLVMGDRAGDLDPAITFHLARAGWTLSDIEAMYESRAGLRGLCGDSDMRAVMARAEAQDPDATLALDTYCYRIRKYVGAYATVLGRVDAVAFTGGVGEHAPGIRARVIDGLKVLGLRLNVNANGAKASEARIVSADASSAHICVIPADEETAIAREIGRLIRPSRD